MRCTNKPDGITRDLLQALGFGNAEPTATVMVGDSATDVQAARAAGLAAIVLVSYGYTATPAHALDADAVIDTLHELPAALALLAGAARVILSIYQMFVIAGLDPAIWWPPPIFVFTGLPAFAGNDSGRGCK
ncbi:MAG: HAD hydrolase-like protein [Methyloceanibacter sp.]